MVTDDLRDSNHGRRARRWWCHGLSVQEGNVIFDDHTLILQTQLFELQAVSCPCNLNAVFEEPLMNRDYHLSQCRHEFMAVAVAVDKFQIDTSTPKSLTLLRPYPCQRLSS